MQVLALGGQERVRRRGAGGTLGVAERAAEAPAAVIQPRPRVGQAGGLEPEQVLRRALEPDRGRMQLAHGREPPVGTRQAQDADGRGRLVQQRHVHRAGLAPEAEQRDAALRQALRGQAPAVRVHDRARPRPVAGHAAAGREQLAEARRVDDRRRRARPAHPSIAAT